MPLADPCLFPGYLSPPRTRIIYVNSGSNGIQTGGVFNGGLGGNIGGIGGQGGVFSGLNAAQQQFVQEVRTWYIRNNGFAPNDQQLAQAVQSFSSATTISNNVLPNTGNGGIVGTVGGVTVGQSSSTVTNSVGGVLPGTIGTNLGGNTSSSTTQTTVTSNNAATVPVVPTTFSSTSQSQSSGVVNNGLDFGIFSNVPGVPNGSQTSSSTTTTTTQQQLIT